MKKLVLAAMMAVSCNFAFAGSNPVQYKYIQLPDWLIVIDCLGRIGGGADGICGIRIMQCDSYGITTTNTMNSWCPGN